MTLARIQWTLVAIAFIAHIFDLTHVTSCCFGIAIGWGEAVKENLS